MKAGFLTYINNFRGIAILYIVLGHCLSAFSWRDNQDVADMLHVVFTNGTVLFVFIAGYLFQYLSPRYAYGKYMRSKVRNVGMPYIIMSIPGILYFTLFAQRPGMEYVNDWPWLLRVLEFYLVGAQLVPFWFIPMIFIHFILSPLYIHGDRNGWLYWLLPAFFIISLLVWRGGPYQMRSYLHYAFVYFLGMFISRHRGWLNDTLSQMKPLVIMGSIIGLLMVLEVYFGIQTMAGKRLNFVQHVVVCLFYIGLLVRLDRFIGTKMDIFASLSFGIFFVHSYFISIIKLGEKHALGGMADGTWFRLALFFIVIVALSIGFVLGVKRLAGKNSRMVCGS